MKNKVFGIVISLLFLGTFVTWESAFTEEIKIRMKTRLPAIVALKDKRILGETNRGYLQFVGQEKEKEEIVLAENKDRKTVYTTIAKQQGVTVDVVEKRRALQIAQKSKIGQWLQDENGKWYQKKW